MSHQAPPSESLLSQRNVRLALAVFVLLTGVYLFTYSGVYLSNDETGLFDATESFARRGNTHVTYDLNVRRVRDYVIGTQPDTPLVDSEPLHILLAAPLFLIAEALPGIGMVHTVWLLNVLVCAGVGSLVLLFARALGYSAGVSTSAALLFGLGTIVWPYSKAFFREPVLMLLLFGAALCLYVWRARWRSLAGWVWFGLFVMLMIMALLTKEAAMMSIPIFVVLALPRVSLRRGWGRVAGLGLLIVVVAGISFFALNSVLEIVAVPRTYDPIARLSSVQGNEAFIIQALGGYLFSPGRSMFVFSPVLVLGIPGAVMLARQRRWRSLLVVLMTLLVFVGGYAVLRHENWFGGLAWGPRYLVPATPFLMLAVLPVLDAFEARRLPVWARWVVVGVLVLAVWVQLNGVLVSQNTYFEYLETRPEFPWLEGTWQLGLTPLAVLPGLMRQTPLDFAWLRVGWSAVLFPLGAISLVLLGAGGLVYWFRDQSQAQSRRNWLATGLLPLAVLVVLYGGLRSIYYDPAYYGDFVPLQDLLNQMEDNLQQDDILVLSNPEYRDFMMNYYRGDALVYTMRLALGEQPSPEQPPRLVSSNPDMLIEPRYTLFLDSLPEYTGRVWVLNNTGPFSTFSVRPVEWYMVRHYFPLQTLETSDNTRLIAFDVVADAPPDPAMRWPDHLADAQFGEAVTLVGYDNPSPRVRVGPYQPPDQGADGYGPGMSVPISLLWRAEAVPASDYNVGLFVVGEQGTVVEQHTAPQGGFRPMNTWQPGDIVRDNHALRLPADLPPGRYEIWVKVYAWQTGEPLSVQGESATAEGTAALLMTFAVAPDS